LRPAHFPFAALAFTAASAAADPASVPVPVPAPPPETTIYGDPEAHFVPDGAQDAQIRREDSKLSIVYTVAMEMRDVVFFSKKELKKEGWRIEWCTPDPKNTFCAVTGSGRDAGALIVHTEDQTAHVTLFLQKR
jgi:hypothetical protein